jgi:pantoate--beta-alanine ligase
VTRFDTIGAWQRERREQIRQGLTLGFVPTMGALHAGHLSLVERSRAENDRTLVSIFVNPAQFGDPADLEAYPRPLDEDLRKLREARADFVLVPEEADMRRDRGRYLVTESEESRTLEGRQRPGHFDAVLTIVLKLLQIAAAERAYFGEKDWQQLTLVRDMAEAFYLPTAIVACPTVREPDGLAYSSRNVRLDPEHRAKAAQFPHALSTGLSAEAVTRELQASGFVVDYVEDRPGRRLGAVRLGGVRLIDNVPLDPHP